MKITLDIDDADFDMLTTESCEWTKLSEERRDEYESVTCNDGTNNVTREWTYAYWVKEGWTAVVMLRSFLEAQGHEYEIALDLEVAQRTWDEDPHPGQWVILTDYASDVYQRNITREAWAGEVTGFKVGDQVSSDLFEGVGTVQTYDTSEADVIRVVVNAPDLPPADSFFNPVDLRHVES